MRESLGKDFLAFPRKIHSARPFWRFAVTSKIDHNLRPRSQELRQEATLDRARVSFRHAEAPSRSIRKIRPTCVEKLLTSRRGAFFSFGLIKYRTNSSGRVYRHAYFRVMGVFLLLSFSIPLISFATRFYCFRRMFSDDSPLRYLPPSPQLPFLGTFVARWLFRGPARIPRIFRGNVKPRDYALYSRRVA